MPRLAVWDGDLRDPAGTPVRLLGLYSAGLEAPGTDLLAVQQLLGAVPAGRRCVVLALTRAAQLRPALLDALARRVMALAELGCYTVLRLDARLWMHGHHLHLASRLAAEPAVHFALRGRAPLAGRVQAAAAALREAHPAAVVWLPLEAAVMASAVPALPGIGWLWDAARPQSPPPAGLRATLRAPVLLDGWPPGEDHPLAAERLVRLCREGGIGWLARAAAPWARLERGTPVLGRAARCLQRALFQAADPRDLP